MRFGQFALISLIGFGLAVPGGATTRTKHGSSSSKTVAKHTVKAKVIGQRGIDDERATQIQEALIKAGYLTGSPSGHWDANSIAAMTKVQADNGWQTKLVPDSRALIKLGLGPGTSPAAGSSAALASSQTTSLAQR
jgi:hypothetical protein